ncbi:hypothetical protein EZV62_003469 [Acer yangbiense]|uniref:Aminotransferase-like plant mobile domain-containing protein n=1 Tax=Acer yangbiense TaxID=1000413 RepID=A0A5C7IHT6_9ROSI|nr:hypothetical protein EZV62_003469 [Acer yangbiense]
MDVKNPPTSYPGPIDPLVLYEQEQHISSATWEGQDRGILRCHEHTSKINGWKLLKKQIDLVGKVGFGHFRLIGQFSLNLALISALVERWRRETNTFHLPNGEITITLDEVARILGLQVDGEAVVRDITCIADAKEVKDGMVKLSWLKEECPKDALDEEMEQRARAFLLYLVGSIIFATTSGNLVPLPYLPLFNDFDKAGKYAWGAAALAFLYRQLGKASMKCQSTISGSLTLLQLKDPFQGVDWKAIGGELQKDPSAGVKSVVKKRLPKRVRQIPEYYFLPQRSWPSAIAFYGSCIAGGIGAGMLLEIWIKKKVKGVRSASGVVNGSRDEDSSSAINGDIALES